MSDKAIRWPDLLPDHPEALTTVRYVTRHLAGYRFVVDPAGAAPETRADLRLASQAAAALFAGPANETVEFTVGRPLRFAALGPQVVHRRRPGGRPGRIRRVAPLGVTLLAQRLGMPVTVSSEYLPENLLTTPSRGS